MLKKCGSLLLRFGRSVLLGIVFQGQNEVYFCASFVRLFFNASKNYVGRKRGYYIFIVSFEGIIYYQHIV